LQPSTPTLRHGAIQVDGPRTADAVQKVVAQRFDRFRACYEAGLRKNPTLADNLAALKEGTVSVRFIIDRTGSVSAASEQGSDLPDRGVSSCVVSAFGTLSFPPGEGTAAVIYPVIFSAG
jgi:phage tail protein X